jgi:thiosulfate/3-mercaptopyruvate sulfurtransferase
MSRFIQLSLILLLASSAARAEGVPPLVDAAWLADRLGEARVAVLDIQDPKDYARFHVPGAVNAPYGRWRTGKKDPAGPSMMPPVGRLEEMIGGLGIDNERTVVIVATGRGAGDLAAAARVFWTFKVLGHGPVAVLDGGLVAWAEGKRPLESGTNRPDPVAYSARPNEDLVLAADGVKDLFDAGSGFVDARTEGEFVGLFTGGKEERPGTIPGSGHLPYDWVTEDGSARLRSADALEALFEARGIATEGEQVHFCHTGNRAALTWFAAYVALGNQEAKLYDGSTKEWARRPDLPLERHIQLCPEGSAC